MNRRPFHFAIALLWLTVPLVAVQYWRAWDQLPARVATHFNAAGEVNGWMSRAVAAEFGVGIVAFVLLVFTPILLVSASRQIDHFAWAILAFGAVLTGLMAFANQQIIAYNLQGTQMHIEPFLIGLPIAAVALAIFFLASQRGQALPASEVLAEETHSGRFWAMVFLPGLIGPWVALRTIPGTGVRLAMIPVIVVVAVSLIAVWTGFRYRFLRHGVEVTLLGYRLRSVPRSQIVSYAAEEWGPLRGYGIRGIGKSRAFVWGNRVVHIKTTNGDVYLGHNDPQTIVRDLDLVMNHTTGN